MTDDLLDKAQAAPGSESQPPGDGQPGGSPLLLAALAAGLVVAFGLFLTFGSSIWIPLLAPAAPPTPDPFAEERRESQAALQRGQRHFDLREFELALLELDRARVHDPDNRADIQALLTATLDELRRAEPARPPTPAAQQPRPTPTPFIVVLSQGSPEARASPTAGQPTATPASPQVELRSFRDGEDRFTVDFPRAWKADERPQAEVGVGVVGFRSPDGKASLVVSVDVLRQSVSPELYAAHLETQMGALPGYQLETANPSVVGGAPALTRQFSIQRAGEQEVLRTVQVVLGRRSWMFILTGTAPEPAFGQARLLFDQIIRSFRITA